MWSCVFSNGGTSGYARQREKEHGTYGRMQISMPCAPMSSCTQAATSPATSPAVPPRPPLCGQP